MHHRDRRFVGVFALIYIPDTVEVEVGYRLHKHAWGIGLATEGASALVDYGFETVGLDRIVGLTHAENDASKKVLMKAGLQPRGTASSANWREIIAFLARGPRPEEIIAFRPLETHRERSRELLDKNRQGTLTPAEESDLEERGQLNYLMMLLKAEARKILVTQGKS